MTSTARRGLRFGVVRAELLPEAATGVGGTVVFGAPGPRLQNPSGAVTATPTGAARPAFNGVVADLPADRRTPLKCHTGPL